jgi:DNA adenine methylase
MSKTKIEDFKLRNYSPLRYPGGKGKLYPFVAAVIEKMKAQHPVYIEPFAGGAGLALSLLFNGVVKEIVINDYDKAIYSMWKAILTQTEVFIELVRNTPVTIEEWYHQKEVYSTQNNKYSLELGYATFFLNRTNRSGILSAGPIGGYQQTGNYLINARFNKEDLINRVKKIARFKSNIHLYNHDVRSFIKSYVPKYIDRAFVYFDPPYYKKGKYLYKNFFEEKDHQDIHDLVVGLECPWMVTYDNAPEIQNIYNGLQAWLFDMVYGVANSGLNSEILFISDVNLLPENLDDKKLKINLRQLH